MGFASHQNIEAYRPRNVKRRVTEGVGSGTAEKLK
jgi:hypothetical protein